MGRHLGFDYARPYTDVQALKAAGAEFVCRYLSTPGNPKNLTRAESTALRSAGIKVVTVFETTANRALGGRAAGIVDARSARNQLALLYAPIDAPVYFAVDFDATTVQQDAINAYLLGAGSILGHQRVGVYGGYYVVARARAANVCRYAWQTYAWSGGKWDPHAQLQQYSNGRRVGTLDVDFNRAVVEDYGQWYGTPAPKPEPRHPQAIPFPTDDTFWTWLRWRTGTGEFAPFGARHMPVRPNVPQRIPAAWWRGLSSYLKAKGVK